MCRVIVRKRSGMALIQEFLKKALPGVDVQLEKWVERCSLAGEEELKIQALASIEKKKFHCQGGSVYSLYPSALFEAAESFIVAFQTISDYLDNLCDRAGVTDETAFRELHRAMVDAVSPGEALHDYYCSYPYKNDGAYLKSLVEACRHAVMELPSSDKAHAVIVKYVQLYSDLQTYKHLELDKRETRLKKWAEAYRVEYPGVYWWEFSAAAGSTLGIFLLFAAACDPEFSEKDADRMDKAYFPWVCGLHILLDYLIDAEEDVQSGDLNFTAYYESEVQCKERMMLFIERSFKACTALPYSEFHHTVIRGLLAMYLSDPKAAVGEKRSASRDLLKMGGGSTGIYYHLCRLLRKMNKL